MKKLIIAASLVATPALAQDPAEGRWQTQPGDDGRYGVVEITPCGADLCGTLVEAYDAGGAPIEDAEQIAIITAMGIDGGGAYSGGRIYAPDRDRTYNSKMALTGDVLKVSGCVFGICRDQTWTRAQ